MYDPTRPNPGQRNNQGVLDGANARRRKELRDAQIARGRKRLRAKHDLAPRAVGPSGWAGRVQPLGAASPQVVSADSHVQYRSSRASRRSPVWVVLFFVVVVVVVAAIVVVGESPSLDGAAETVADLVEEAKSIIAGTDPAQAGTS